MIERLKKAFGSVHAPDEAKKKALYAIESRRKNTARRRIAAAFQTASACAAAILAVVCINIYHTETAYVSLDINPSMSFAINDYGRVITAVGYGAESEQVLSSVRVDGMPYADAVETVMSASSMKPYLMSDRTIWIAVQANNPITESEMEYTVEAAVQAAVDNQGIDIAHHAVTEEIRSTAENAGITATRYIAISELQEVDPAASIDSYRHTSIGEIHEQTASHHSETNEPEAEYPHSSESDYVPETATVSPPEEIVPTAPPTVAHESEHHGHNAGHH